MPTEPEELDPYEGCDVLRGCVERALEPYRALPPEDLEELRTFLIVHVTTHPALEPLYKRLRKRKVASNSRATSATAEDALAHSLGAALRGARRGRP